METTPETEALFAELFDRCGVVEELDGPQVEAFVSGLMPLFDDAVAPALGFIEHCAKHGDATSGLVCGALSELVSGDDQQLAAAASAVVDKVASGPGLAAVQSQIGASELTGAWTVTAPFGRSIMLGYVNPVAAAADADREDDPAEVEPVDAHAEGARHSILVELDAGGSLADLQLSGAAELMVDDASSVDSRVFASPIDLDEGLSLVLQAWPGSGIEIENHGPGIAANQQFVRHRLWKATGTLVPAIDFVEPVIDVRRGLDDAGFAEANAAALSTLHAALGDGADVSSHEADTPSGQAWVGVVRGDGGEVSGREREALLWLEWADWLGVGIGLARAGEGAEVSGPALVGYVNRCPEVSSTIDKADRDYAEWAFSVAIDVLEDAGAVTDGLLSGAGRRALVPALVRAWQAES